MILDSLCNYGMAGLQTLDPKLDTLNLKLDSSPSYAETRERESNTNHTMFMNQLFGFLLEHHEHVSNIFLGDTMVPNIEYDYILLFGTAFYTRIRILLGSTTKKYYSCEYQVQKENEKPCHSLQLLGSGPT